MRPAPVDTQHNAGFSAAIRSIVDPRSLVSFGINEVVPRLFGSLAQRDARERKVGTSMSRWDCEGSVNGTANITFTNNTVYRLLRGILANVTALYSKFTGFESR